MTCTLLVEQGSPPVLQTTLRDAITGLPVDSATVLVTIADAGGTSVAGATWPLALGYVADSAGIYRVQLDAAVALVAGQPYTAFFAITYNGVTINRKYDVYVAPLGCGDEPDPSSAASPAYQGPPLLQMLNEAESAYHQMQLGKNVVTVKDQNGEEVTYSPANRTALAQYIASLKAQLGLVNMRPVSVSFGHPWRRFGGFRR